MHDQDLLLVGGEGVNISQVIHSDSQEDIQEDVCIFYKGLQQPTSKLHEKKTLYNDNIKNTMILHCYSL